MKFRSVGTNSLISSVSGRCTQNEALNTRIARSKVSIVIVGVLLALSSIVVAGDRPNHLVPIDAYDLYGKGYAELVFRTLVKDRYPKIWMIVRPSFGREYAVILKRVEPKDSSSIYYELEYARAEKKIWYRKDIGDGTKILDLRKDVDVERHVIRLQDNVAKNLVESWEAVLRKTRYAENDVLRIDGVGYEFYARSNHSFLDLFGQTWSPKSGIPKMMVDCGDLLIEIVKSSASDRESLIVKTMELTKELREAVK